MDSLNRRHVSVLLLVFAISFGITLIGPANTAEALGPRCPKGWFCLFEHANWKGKMWKFRECGRSQSLANYDAQNKVSSWHNRTHYDAFVEDSGGTLLWISDSGGAKASYVGAKSNDRAWFIQLYC